MKPTVVDHFNNQISYNNNSFSLELKSSLYYRDSSPNLNMLRDRRYPSNLNESTGTKDSSQQKKTRRYRLTNLEIIP